MRKGTRLLLIFFLAILTLAAAGAYYLLGTPYGAEKTLRYIAARSGFSGFEIGSCGGDFFRGWVFRGLHARCDFYTAGKGELSVDEAGLKFSFPRNFYLAINNGCFRRQGADPVIFYGTYNGGVLDFNFYTKRINIKNLLLLFFKNNYFVNGSSGEAQDADIYIRGTVKKPVFSGKFLIKRLTFKDFSAESVPTSLSLVLDDLFLRTPRLYGAIIFNSGTIANPHSAKVTLKKSRIVFDGDPARFVYDFTGNAKVDNIPIDIVLRGDRANPDLKLFSDPLLPRDELLVMIMTNRSWAPGSTNASAATTISSAIAADAIDYFVFAGEGRKFSQAIGLGVSVNLNQNSRTLCVTKNLGDKLAAGYAITQCRTVSSANAPATDMTTHAVTGEYKVTDTISIEAAHGLDRQPAGANMSSAPEEKVMLKYKKEF